MLHAPGASRTSGSGPGSSASSAPEHQQQHARGGHQARQDEGPRRGHAAEEERQRRTARAARDLEPQRDRRLDRLRPRPAAARRAAPTRRAAPRRGARSRGTTRGGPTRSATREASRSPSSHSDRRLRTPAHLMTAPLPFDEPRELAPHGLAGPRQPALDRAFGHAERRRHFLAGEPLHLAQHQHRAVLEAQLQERRLDPPRALVPQGLFVGARRRGPP